MYRRAVGIVANIVCGIALASGTAEAKNPTLPGFSDYAELMRGGLADAVNHFRQEKWANTPWQTRQPFVCVRTDQVKFRVVTHNPIEEAFDSPLREMEAVKWTVIKGPMKGLSGDALVRVTYGRGPEAQKNRACLPWTVAINGKTIYDYPSARGGSCTYGGPGRDGVYRTFPNPAKYRLGPDGIYRNTPIVWNPPPRSGKPGLLEGARRVLGRMLRP